MTKNQRVISKKKETHLKRLAQDSYAWQHMVCTTMDYCYFKHENSNCIQILYQTWCLLVDGTLQVINTYWFMRPNVICVADWVKVSFMQKFGHISNLYLWLTFNSALRYFNQGLILKDFKSRFFLEFIQTNNLIFCSKVKIIYELISANY